jgi:hypothetical protein
MATRLKNILVFTNLLEDVTVFLPHLLNFEGIPLIPDKVEVNSQEVIVVVDDTNVTLTPSLNIAEVDVSVEYWYSPERLAGDPSDNFFDQFANPPFILTGGDGGSTDEAIRVDISGAGTQSIPNTTMTPIVFDTVAVQIGTALTLAAGNVSVGQDGMYIISIQTDWAVGASAVNSWITINAGNQDRGRSRFDAAIVGNTRYSGTSPTNVLSAGDVVGMTVEQNSGGALNVVNAVLEVVRLIAS